MGLALGGGVRGERFIGTMIEPLLIEPLSLALFVFQDRMRQLVAGTGKAHRPRSRDSRNLGGSLALASKLSTRICQISCLTIQEDLELKRVPVVRNLSYEDCHSSLSHFQPCPMYCSRPPSLHSTAHPDASKQTQVCHRPPLRC